MREIIYIQIGPLSNYIGTHFWNTQQCYFNYKSEGENEPVVDHDISFREGLTLQGEPTYCPRVLIVDRKTNFGSLSTRNALYDGGSETKEDLHSSWNGVTEEVYQEPVPSGSYQAELEEEVDEDLNATSADLNSEALGPALLSDDVRYWSDYNRVYYHPRSLHKLPDVLEFENSDGDWTINAALFERYELENRIVDDSFRHFIEESDNCQGINVTADASLGPFSLALMTAVRDEYPKLPSLSFPILSRAAPNTDSVDSLRAVRATLNDARRLCALEELSLLNIPLESPSNWTLGSWSNDLNMSLLSSFETSSVLSAHIETATLPLRLKRSESLLEFCSRFNYCRNTPFAELSGAFPLESEEHLDERVHNFTMTFPRRAAPKEVRDRGILFRHDCIRGFENVGRVLSAHARATQAVALPVITSIRAPLPYPLPTSYPYFFRAPHLNDRSRRTTKGLLTINRTVPLVSSLGLHSDGLPVLLKRQATFVDECLRKKIAWDSVGMGLDDARDLAAQLWTIHDTIELPRSDSQTADDIDVDEEF